MNRRGFVNIAVPVIVSFLICLFPFFRYEWSSQPYNHDVGQRYMHVMAYDSVEQKTLLWGGFGFYDENVTWAWNGVEWSLRSSFSPPILARAAMTFNSEEGVMVLFGGIDVFDQNHDETWELLDNQWSVAETGGPPARNAHDMFYHAGSNQVVMMGGINQFGVLGDSWVYQNGWTQLDTSPPPRYGHTMTYDSDNDVVLLFGGMNENGKISRDLWQWDGVSWTRLGQFGQQSHPGGRWFGRMVYDSDQKLILLFAGHDGVQQRDDVWAWDGSQWTEVLINGLIPLPRHSHGMAYDSARQNVVLYGGAWDVIGDLGDTWVLESKDGIAFGD